ncbi:MAG: hypothetical protein ACREQM_03095 [Candidatus Dormibacteraceae bacterium]
MNQQGPGTRRWRRLGDIAILVVGLIAPLGVLAVNGAVFLMDHVSTFRLIIAVMTAVSGLVLNSLVARQALRFARANLPLIYKEYRRWILVLAILAVIVSVTLGTFLTYEGMANVKQLPSLLAVLGSLVALAMPFALTFGERVVLRPILELRARRRGRRHQPTQPPATRVT